MLINGLMNVFIHHHSQGSYMWSFTKCKELFTYNKIYVTIINNLNIKILNIEFTYLQNKCWKNNNHRG